MHIWSNTENISRSFRACHTPAPAPHVCLYSGGWWRWCCSFCSCLFFDHRIFFSSIATSAFHRWLLAPVVTFYTHTFPALSFGSHLEAKQSGKSGPSLFGQSTTFSAFRLVDILN